MGNTIEDWWDEDAERVEGLIRLANSMNVIEKVGDGKPVKLDKDGLEITKKSKNGVKLLMDVLKKTISSKSAK